MKVFKMLMLSVPNAKLEHTISWCIYIFLNVCYCRRVYVEGIEVCAEIRSTFYNLLNSTNTDLVDF